jgi:hypothetical protein
MNFNNINTIQIKSNRKEDFSIKEFNKMLLFNSNNLINKGGSYE